MRVVEEEQLGGRNSLEDHLDLLVPPPRSWPARFAIGLASFIAIVLISWGWGQGLVRPRPECCGSTSSGSYANLADGGKAVSIHYVTYNSSGSALEIGDANVDLPGATVLAVQGIEMQDTPSIEGSGSVTVASGPERLLDFPYVVSPRGSVQLRITFVPNQCTEAPGSGPWGSVTSRLSIHDASWPTLDRTYRWPNPVDRVDGTRRDHPLEQACALLKLS